MGSRRAGIPNDISWVALFVTALLACGGDDVMAVPAPRSDGGPNEPTLHHSMDGDDDGGTKPITVHPRLDAGSTNDEEDAGASDPSSCGDVNCGLHGDCVMGMDGKPGCVCDHGYIDDGQSSDTGGETNEKVETEKKWNKEKE